MYLKCRHVAVLYLMIFIVTLSSCNPSYRYDVAQKIRADNIEDYGERLSSIERGRRDSSSRSNEDNEGYKRLSATLDPKTQEDAAQEEGMSVQDDQAVKLQEQKSSSKQLLTKDEDNGSQEKKFLDEKNVSLEEEQDVKLLEQKSSSKQILSNEKDSQGKKLLEEKNVSPEENTQEKETKTLKSDEKDKSQHENENESATELHLSGEVNEDKFIDNLNVESSTRCTTDREITIGDYKPPQDSQNTDDTGGGDNDGKGGGDDDGKVDGKDDKDNDVDGDKSSKALIDERSNEIDGESEKKVSKVYRGPKPAKAPDHYIDDI